MSDNHDPYVDYLKHHGILGQKWGVKNGPPYPLAEGDHNARERLAGWTKSLKKGFRKRLRAIKSLRTPKQIANDFKKTTRKINKKILKPLNAKVDVEKNKLKNAITKKSEQIKKDINKEYKKVTKEVKQFKKKVSSVTTKYTKGAKLTLASVKQTIINFKNKASKTLDSFVNGLKSMNEKIGGLTGAVKKTINAGKALHDIDEKLSWGTAGYKALASSAKSKVVDALKNIGMQKVSEGIREKVSEVVENAKDTISDLTNKQEGR